MSAREGYQLKRVLHAYHEAGHAVVWHVVGGLIEEVSIASLLKHRTFDGRDAHLAIWRIMGYPDADWRFGALNIQWGQVK